MTGSFSTEGRYTVYKERSDAGNSSNTHASLAQEGKRKCHSEWSEAK